MFRKKLFIRFSVPVFLKRLSIYVCARLSLSVFWRGICNLFVFVRDHCLSFYPLLIGKCKVKFKRKMEIVNAKSFPSGFWRGICNFY